MALPSFLTRILIKIKNVASSIFAFFSGNRAGSTSRIHPEPATTAPRTPPPVAKRRRGGRTVSFAADVRGDGARDTKALSGIMSARYTDDEVMQELSARVDPSLKIIAPSVVLAENSLSQAVVTEESRPILVVYPFNNGEQVSHYGAIVIAKFGGRDHIFYQNSLAGYSPDERLQELAELLGAPIHNVSVVQQDSRNNNICGQIVVDNLTTMSAILTRPGLTAQTALASMQRELHDLDYYMVGAGSRIHVARRHALRESSIEAARVDAASGLRHREGPKR